MSLENVLWGAPRIQGERLKLGFTVAQSTVAKYMVKRDDPSGQNCTFLHNHAPHIAAMDLFAVPTIGFIQLYVLVIVRLARRELALVNVTRRPTAEWRSKSPKPSRGMTSHAIWSATRTRFTVLPSPTGYAPWVFGTSRLRQGRHGRTGTQRD
jgi:hypothetical protein